MAFHSLAILVVLGFVAHQAVAYNCYICGTQIDSTNTEYTPGLTTNTNPCAEIASATVSADAGTYGCETVYTNGGRTFSISRGISKLSSTTTGGSYCEQNSDGTTTTCYCFSDKCNSQKVSAPRTYNCYDCSSSEYFDNGCGQKLDTSIGYVRTTTGCSACYKTVTIDTDQTVRYVRGCSRGIQVDDSCIGDESEYSTRKCACKKDLCNSAQSHVIKTSSVIFAAIVSALLKYFH